MLAFDGGAVDGAVSADGRVAGAYVHGLFERGEARAALLAPLGLAITPRDHAARVDAALDEIAAMLERSLDIEAIARIAGL
jgi:adenosylcobyric acid synthase